MQQKKKKLHKVLGVFCQGTQIEFKHFLDHVVYMDCYIFAFTLTALFKYTSSYITHIQIYY